MITHLWTSLLATTDPSFHWFQGFLNTHLVNLLGFAMGLLVMGQLIRKRRQTSNIFAWFLLIVFMPFIGTILYFLFGGTKSRAVLRNKARVSHYAAKIAEKAHPTIAPNPKSPFAFQPVPGNALTLLPDNIACFNALCREIKQAQECIQVVTYILSDDEAGRSIVDLLVKRAREGLEVKLLIDAVGSMGRRRLTEPIRKAGGSVQRFMPVIPLHTKTSANLRNHRKMAIFDHQRAILGGQNIDARFMGPKTKLNAFRDFSALVEGPVVSHLNRTFINDWCFATGEPPEKFKEELISKPDDAGDILMQAIPSGPDMERDTIWEHWIIQIQECKETLTVVTPYFLPDTVIMASLAVKAHMGKKITLILPEHSNQKILDRARYHHLRELHNQGIDIQFYQPSMLHAKLFIVDSKVARLGSANMDLRSLFVNFEIELLIQSPSTVQTLQAWADSLLPNCKPFAQSDKARASPGRVLLEDIAYLMTPLL